MKIPALWLIDEIAASRAQAHADPERGATLARVQKWQVARLRATYADFHSLDRYHDALEFFVQDLYAPRDFQQRDRDLRRVIHTWHRVLPARGIEAITRALELEALTQSLDVDLVSHLGSAPLSDATYASAYRSTNRRRDRQRQIWLILSAGRSLDALIAHPWVPTVLRAARRPARLAGVSALHEFLERGYAAFEKMSGAEDLLRAIENRETSIMKNLFAGAPKPFAIERKNIAARKA